jgi:hypothetical protein
MREAVSLHGRTIFPKELSSLLPANISKAVPFDPIQIAVWALLNFPGASDFGKVSQVLATYTSCMVFFQESQYTVGDDRKHWFQIGALTQAFDAVIEQCQADRMDEVARLRSRAFGAFSLLLNSASRTCTITDLMNRHLNLMPTGQRFP